MSKVSPARKVAFDVLMAIETLDGLSSKLSEFDEKLGPNDRGLCHELVLGTLRKQIGLDREIDIFAKGKKLDAAVRVSLRMGLHQLRNLDRVPDHAAINESVELVRIAKRSSAAGFVNAILRRATRETANVELIDELDQLSVETSHPRRLLERWTTSFGGERTAKIARRNNDRPTLYFRPTHKADEEVRRRLEHYVSPTFTDIFSANVLNEDLLAMLKNGSIYVQDAASQQIAYAVSSIIKNSFLDVCASPGGKTGAISMARNGRDLVRIAANDISDARVKILRENLEAQGCLNVSIAQFDAVEPILIGETFDTILVDAPCSGTGTIRHHPEIRYRVDDHEIRRHAERQLAILQNASELLDVGGTLVYSTCSLEIEENESVIEQFLAQNPEFSVTEIDLGDRYETDRGTYRIWPDEYDTDGFFVAALTRRQK